MAIKIMIVDDSPFSRTIIAETLTDGGYEVVGEADSLETALETYNKTKPDIVTMDIAMPEADGFEVSRALLRNDPKAKIILSSSMKDEETELEAKRVGISGYVQKPVEADNLFEVIRKVLSPDTLFQELLSRGLDTFKEALSQNITRMAKTSVSFIEDAEIDDPYQSKGVTTIIGIIGQYTGTMILDLSFEVAEKIAETILRRPAKNPEEVLAMVSELANIIGGIACSMLNKREKALGLRVSPPSMFHGNSAELVSPSVKIHKSLAQTEYGVIFLGVGFKKGSTLWM
ncbi:DNA-binding response regulator, NarL/FixJ family, contains REC and HTH domains [Propionispira arboris]|uniref:DNA-binding response regulator, NarL/FixJ family, contains REC and HTH domains n=1 Tax=Propionispira arboris TaxID=84035 RepID=A0A1H6V9U6_9FIRM|nr:MULTISPECIES: response regulator [Propionispira]SEJ00596.1 DNA-binding response regulator, NarL/FixJ family, contains REC and HTH domains [Propionispira arboris]